MAHPVDALRRTLEEHASQLQALSNAQIAVFRILLTSSSVIDSQRVNEQLHILLKDTTITRDPLLTKRLQEFLKISERHRTPPSQRAFVDLSKPGFGAEEAPLEHEGKQRRGNRDEIAQQKIDPGKTLGAQNSRRSKRSYLRRHRRHDDPTAKALIVVAIVVGLAILSVPAYFILSPQTDPLNFPTSNIEGLGVTKSERGMDVDGRERVSQGLRDEFKRYAIREHGVLSLEFASDWQFSVTLKPDLYADKAVAASVANHLAIAYKNRVHYTGPVFVIVLQDARVFATGRS